MTPLNRRDFLKSSAGMLGVTTVLGGFPAVIQRALAVAPNTDTGTIEDIQHVVIVMQENRSFDHYFGTLRGVRGFGDRFPIPLETGEPVWSQSDGTRVVAPFHLDSTLSNALLVQDTPHFFPDTQAAWNQGKYGEWPRFKTGISMGHYQREDIPFQFALADAFTLCDAYHCSLTACTDPNRIVLFSGSNSDPALREQGINCTDADAEVTNLRCVVGGAMPGPGYTFNGQALTWPTLPELLEAAGVSWKIYQDPNDNWGGLMHGGLAFQSFRTATAASGSPLYDKGMKHWSLEDLRNDVVNGTLPAVTWILPSPAQSEHPAAQSSPDRAGDFTAQILDALTTSSDSWSKTALFLTFDENDGFFDHVPPPAVPSYNADGTLAGASTLPLAGEYFSDPTSAYLLPEDTITGTVRPWGLGPRVPMYVISPWSKGGWVNSQIFDHTSLCMFLEKRFGIVVPSISPWRRAICGDLTSAFDFRTPDVTPATLPDVSGYAAVEALQRTLPAPQPPSTPAPLFQESGTRHSRALAYELHTSARVSADGLLTLIFANSGSQGAVYHAYDRNHLDRIPRRYTVEAGKILADDWRTNADSGIYDIWVYGPNGYVRTFKGDALTQSAAAAAETQICYDPSQGQIYVKVHNTGTTAVPITVLWNAYRSEAPTTLDVDAHSVRGLNWGLASSANWYDLTVTTDAWERRFAGRMETGADGISDPAMATQGT